MTDTAFVKDFKATLRSGVPLVCVQSGDPASVIQQVLAITQEKDTDNYDTPILSWDIASGLKLWSNTEKGKEALRALLSAAGNVPQEKVTDPVASIKLLKYLPRKSIVFIMNGHRLLHARNLIPEAVIGQALWNLRDEFKASRRTAVILSPNISLPPELVNDVLVLEEPLPTTAELRSSVLDMHKAAGLEAPKPFVLSKAIETVRGISLFAAEQAIAMSFTEEGLDLRKLFDRKRMQVEQTPGLSVYEGRETFKDLEGVSAIKNYMKRLFNGKEPPTVIVFLDEMEKMFAGIQGDLSGVSQDQHGEFLKWTQDKKIMATMWVGHPGCSKSFTAKCCAGEFDVPMVEMNIGAMKAGVIGSTGSNTRGAFKMASAIGIPLLIATSNKQANLPPELKRRFRMGTWFFGLPGDAERQATWKLYMSKYGLKDALTPEDKGWTPDEIETCCKNAWRFGCSLIEAKQYVVPISEQDPEAIKLLCEQANNKFLDASAGKTYKYDSFAYNEEKMRTINVKGGGQA